MSYSTRANLNKTYEPNFRSVVGQINEAIKRGLPDAQEQSKYRRVAVLMIHWSNDNLGIVPLETQLAQVFAKVYNFTVETYSIPTIVPAGQSVTREFQRRLTKFVDSYEGPHSLMIYVYSGHADAGAAPLYDQCIWYGSDAIPLAQCPQVDWAALRVTTDIAIGDTLYILDCCYASTAAINKTENEYLVAAAMENPAGSAIQTSFTQRLINILVANNGSPQTVASMHASMVSNMKAANTNMSYTPIHIAANVKPTIILQRLAKTPKDIQAVKQFDTRAAGKVLISVSLQGKASYPDVEKFEKWLLTNMPPNVASVKVEAAFHASSHLVLFTVPLEVWAYLEGNEAFRFIDHVDSHNLLLSKPLQQGQGSPSKGSPAQGFPAQGSPSGPKPGGLRWQMKILPEDRLPHFRPVLTRPKQNGTNGERPEQSNQPRESARLSIPKRPSNGWKATDTQTRAATLLQELDEKRRSIPALCLGLQNELRKASEDAETKQAEVKDTKAKLSSGKRSRLDPTITLQTRLPRSTKRPKSKQTAKEQEQHASSAPPNFH
ncbi:MAG: hypothetical protein Q9210_005777 [Variospora velana]